MWLASERDDAAEDLRGSRARSNVLTLPGFDELILGYKDRRAFLEPDQFAAVVPGNNGVFCRRLLMRAALSVSGSER